MIDLLDSSNAKVRVVAAPAGFGKTTVVAQWCRDRSDPVAWTHLDFTDRDPLVLMSTLLASLRDSNCITDEALERLDGLTADEPAFSRWVLPAFRTVVEGVSGGTVVVMDDAHDAITVDNARIVAAMVDSMAESSRLVLVARRRPEELPLARWLGQGSLLEVGPELLALSDAEIAEVLATTTGTQPDDSTVRAISERTDGWPVAVYLSAAPAPSPRSPAASRDQVHGYLIREVVESLDPAVAEFFGRTSMLGALSARLCDQTLDVVGSDAMLRVASAETTLLSPLGTNGDWYRLHPLVRETLLAQYEAAHPDETRRAHQRASAWYDGHGFAEEALAHACSGGDADKLGEIVWRYGLPALLVGRASTVQGWVENAVGSEPQSRMSAELAMTAAWTAMMQGRGADVVRWTDDAVALLGPDWESRATETDVEPSVATLVATRMTAGHQTSGWLASNAYAHLPVQHPLRPLARLIHGWAVTMGGDVRHGRRLMDHSASLSESMDLATTWVEALALRSVAEWSVGDLDAASASIRQANEVWIARSLIDASATTALLCCAAAAVHAARGEHDAARVAIARSDALAPAVQASLPWIGGLRDVLDASAYVDMGEPASANIAVDQARSALAQLPSSPFLTRALTGVESRLAQSVLPAKLTPAEMRVAQHIDSPLGAAAIAAELGVSYETVKSHLASIYRKLGVSSRQDAAVMLRQTRKR